MQFLEDFAKDGRHKFNSGLVGWTMIGVTVWNALVLSFAEKFAKGFHPTKLLARIAALGEMLCI